MEREISSNKTFRNTFQGRDLKQGTSIILTWLEPTKMLVCNVVGYHHLFTFLRMNSKSYYLFVFPLCEYNLFDSFCGGPCNAVAY